MEPSLLNWILSMCQTKKLVKPRDIYIDGESGSGSVSTNPTVIELETLTDTLTTNTSLADMFTVTLTQNITITCTNGIDGKGTPWLLTQGTGGNKIINLDSTFTVPDSAGPLTWSTTAGKTDILAARYSVAKNKWLVVSVVPGY